jgi:hypothetical protein
MAIPRQQPLFVLFLARQRPNVSGRVGASFHRLPIGGSLHSALRTVPLNKSICRVIHICNPGHVVISSPSS